VPRLATFLDLRGQNHTLGLYCVECDRWGAADLERLIAAGRGEDMLVSTRFRCKDCGQLVEKQLRPPVPTISGAEAYIRA
jgi:hypothetical protein